MSSVQIPSNPLREYFSRSWMSLEKPLLLPTKVPPWFTSVFLKLALQFQKLVQPDLKPVQPVSVLFLLPPLTCQSASQKLSEKSCAEFFENRFNQIWVRLNRILGRSSLRLSSSVNRELPGGNRFNLFKNQFNRFLVHFSQRLPAFGGSLKYPSLSLSLSSFTSALPRFLSWPTSKQRHSFHLSHPKSHPLQSFEGSLVWGEVDLTHCWFHLDSPILFILELIANLTLCGFVTLGTLCSLMVRGCLGVSKFVDNPKKFVSPALWAIWEEIALTLVVDLWRIKVGKDPTLCGLLNEE
jgi:hypothetical protein